MQLGTVVKVPVDIDTSGAVTYDTTAVTGDTAEAVEIGIDTAYKKADTSAYSEVLEDAAYKGVFNGIKDAIKALDG